MFLGTLLLHWSNPSNVIFDIWLKPSVVGLRQACLDNWLVRLDASRSNFVSSTCWNFSASHSFFSSWDVAFSRRSSHSAHRLHLLPCPTFRQEMNWPHRSSKHLFRVDRPTASSPLSNLYELKRSSKVPGFKKRLGACPLVPDNASERVHNGWFSCSIEANSKASIACSALGSSAFDSPKLK